MTRLNFIHELEKIVIACECEENESAIHSSLLYWYSLKVKIFYGPCANFSDENFHNA